ncbi:cyclic AMP phosphodiesterase [Spiribacter salinus M19-40]|uniref:Cyclic AMP phosphodiesterase n=1 Tax=Spiribacter salinus M19-40 TaxID=1260251 RepID=R4VQC9_9GAMM|nr:metallophosphoesterase [Spiribacter salinus]AGM41658.1 cyclic AMP phosphodiesterase [Spiribacter salinus M19-40]
MGVQRLLQVTDTHLLADPAAQHAGVSVESRFQATLAAMQPWAAEAHALVHTGDLVDDGSVAAYQRLRAALETLGLPGRVTPGNHDERRAMAEVFSDGLITAARSLALGDWCVVMLDTLSEGEVPGQLTADELAGLDAALAATDARHVLLALHHPPCPVGTVWLDAIGLQEPAALRARLLEDGRIRGLVMGHVHQAFDGTLDGCRCLATPATAAPFLAGAETFALDDGPPGFRWLDLHPDGRIETGVEFATPDEDNPLSSASSSL